MAGINWSELVANAEHMEPWEKKAPKKQKAPVITWSSCQCSKSHKTSRTFFECAIGKKYSHNGSNAHLNRVYPEGSGDWAVMSERWSEVYYSEHNGKTNNLQHLQVFIKLFETFEEASDYFLRAKENCDMIATNSSLYKAVVKVAL